MTFETEDSQTVFEGRVFKVRQDWVHYPDGRRIQLDIVEHNGAVTILPVDDEGQIWFIRQYRHAAGKELLELPAGVAETGEAVEISALRELREEIGMGAKQMEKIGSFYLAPGYSTEFMHVFLARDLRPDPLPGDADEFISVEPIPLDVVLKMIESGKIHDAKTLASLMLAKRHIV